MYQAFAPMDAGISDRDLRIEIFALCESASDQNGRLSILGTFETIQSLQFPVILHQAVVVLRVRFWPTESRQHKVRMMFNDPDGRQVLSPVESDLTLQPPNEDQSAAYNLLLHVRDLRLQAAGEHAIDFFLNDNLQGRLPLIVLPLPRTETSPSW